MINVIQELIDEFTKMSKLEGDSGFVGRSALSIINKKLNNIDNDIINRLKSIRRFNVNAYRDGEFGFDTELEYFCNGEYIHSCEIDEIIKELEKNQNK